MKSTVFGTTELKRTSRKFYLKNEVEALLTDTFSKLFSVAGLNCIIEV